MAGSTWRARLLGVLAVGALVAAPALATLAGPVAPAAAATPTATATATTTTTTGPCGTRSDPAPLSKTLVIVMENQDYDAVIGAPAAPYLNSLAAQCGLGTSYSAVTHPSLPNYLSMSSGQPYNRSPFNVDCSPSSTCSSASPSVFGQIKAAGKQWRTYAEGMSGNCSPSYAGKYAPKHNPPLYFPADAADCATWDVPMGTLTSGALAGDLAAGTLPTYAFVAPDLCHQGHDVCGTGSNPVTQGDTWLSQVLPTVFSSADYTAGRLAVFVTWDESAGSGDVASRVPLLVASPYTAVGARDARATSHWSLLRTVEEVSGVPLLGQAGTAPSLRPGFGLDGPAVDQPPTAAFTAGCSGLTCTFDGSASGDPDGPLAGWAWDFGDGSPPVGRPTTAHTYATPGDRVVRLTVTDSAHTTGTTTRTVTPTAPDPASPQVWATDAFSRTASNGFGTAPTGGTWVATSSSPFSVDGAVGRISLGANTGPGAYLGAVSTSDADTRVTFSSAQVMTGNGATLSLVGRRVTGVGDYRAPLKLSAGGGAQLWLARATSTGVETVLRSAVTVPGGAVAPGDGVVVRMTASGTSPTVLRAKAWKAGTAEPTAWQVTVTDSTAGLQVPGTIGVRPYVSSSVTNGPIVVGVDDLSSRSTNLPPTAAQTSSCSGLTCTFDGSGSTDPEGPVASWTWDFGDGSPTVGGATVTHAYAAAGAYSAALTVADGAGATGLTASTVTATAPPAGSPPTASFTSSCSQLSCSFDGTGSSDPDGTVTGWAWDFGDGATGSGATVTHDYAAGGPVTVTLVVTDDTGATGSAGGQADPVAPPTPGTPPTASFTTSCPALTCSFDGSGSADADGPLASWAWDFGDGTAGSGATPTHAYPTAGDYTVRLTVTDGDGQTGTAAQLLSPRPPPNPAPAIWAQDAFSRTVSGGLGTAPTGGPWSVTGGASTFSVDGQTGRISLAAGTGPGAYLAQVAASDTDTSVTFSVDKPVTGGGAYLSLVGRRVPTAGDYRATLRLVAGGSAQLSLLRVSTTGVETAVRAAVTVPGLTLAAGDRFAVRLQVVGTGATTLRGKAWQTTSPEPAAWLLSGTDTTAALQVKGSVGVRPYLSSTTTNAPLVVSVDDVLSRASGSAPTAVAQATCAGLTCSLDGTGSSDPDGPLASWVWDFGDGTPPASGSTVSHTYATPGARRVTLTVTDAAGWTAVTARAVDVS